MKSRLSSRTTFCLSEVGVCVEILHPMRSWPPLLRQVSGQVACRYCSLEPQCALVNATQGLIKWTGRDSKNTRLNSSVLHWCPLPHTDHSPIPNPLTTHPSTLGVVGHEISLVPCFLIPRTDLLELTLPKVMDGCGRNVCRREHDPHTSCQMSNH